MKTKNEGSKVQLEEESPIRKLVDDGKESIARLAAESKAVTHLFTELDKLFGYNLGDDGGLNTSRLFLKQADFVDESHSRDEVNRELDGAVDKLNSVWNGDATIQLSYLPGLADDPTEKLDGWMITLKIGGELAM